MSRHESAETIVTLAIEWWKDEDTRLVHFIGKDNIVFHCIVFPSMLKAHGDYILPENVPANEFLNLEGDKISTSRNWAVWLHEYLEEFPGKEDVLRYVLCANAPETKDNDFTWKDYQARNNNELVAVLGNFVNRALVLTKKYYDGVVPACGELSDYDRDTIAELSSIKASLEGNIENYRFREALKDAMNFARIGNKYIVIGNHYSRSFVYDLENGKTLYSIFIGNGRMFMSRDEKLIVIIENNDHKNYSSIYIYDTNDGHLINEIRSHKTFSLGDISPNNKQIILVVIAILIYPLGFNCPIG